MNSSITSTITKSMLRKNIKYIYYIFSFIISIYLIMTSIYSISQISSSRNDILIEMHQITKQINASQNSGLITKEYINNKINGLEDSTIFNIEYDISTHTEGHIFTLKANIKNEDIFFLFKPIFHDTSFKNQELLFIRDSVTHENLIGIKEEIINSERR